MNDIDPVMVSLGREMVDASGRMLQDLLGTAQVDVKGPFDLVTKADVAVESYVTGRLREVYPTHQLVAEEAADATKQPTLAEYCWVLDPLDGTVNFAFGVPFYCVSLALLHRGSPVLGWVLDPVRNELFFAQRGQPPMLNDRLLTVSEGHREVLPIGMSTGLLERCTVDAQGQGLLLALIQRFGKLRIFGSQALHLCYVAAGRLRAAVNMEAKLWDDAAGALVVESGGGLYTDFRGEKIFPLPDNSPLLRGAPVGSLAGDPAAHALLREVLAAGAC